MVCVVIVVTLKNQKSKGVGYPVKRLILIKLLVILLSLHLGDEGYQFVLIYWCDRVSINYV